MRELRTSARLRNFCAQFDDVVLGSGDYFGEQALITGDVRAATVTAAEDVSLLALDRENFQRVGDSSFQAPPLHPGPPNYGIFARALGLGWHRCSGL